MSSMNQSLALTKERTAQFGWTVFILMFFCIQAVIWSVAISITARDTSHAVVDGYDEQALNWDEVKKARQQSAALGWGAEFKINSVADVRGERAISLMINDRNGDPISKAQLQVSAFHRGTAAERQDIDFKEVGPGVYTSRIQINRFGKWCFSGTVSVTDQIFLIDEVVQIPKHEKKKR